MRRATVSALAPGQVQHPIRHHHLDLDLGPFGAEGGDMAGQHTHRQQVGRGDADRPSGPLVLSGNLQRQRGDFFLDADEPELRISSPAWVRA